MFLLAIALILAILIVIEDIRSNNMINKADFFESKVEKVDSLRVSLKENEDNGIKVSIIKSIKC